MTEIKRKPNLVDIVIKYINMYNQLVTPNPNDIYKSDLEMTDEYIFLLNLGRKVVDIFDDMIGEYNDRQTRAEYTVKAANKIMEVDGVQEKIRDWKVVCDDSNNTPEVIDGHQMILDVVVQEPNFKKYNIRFTLGGTNE